MKNNAIFVVLVLALVSVAAFGQDAAPPQIEGTGVDVFGWAVSKFGWPGIAVWIAWLVRGWLATAKTSQGLPLHLTGPIIIELHPNTLSKFMPRNGNEERRKTSRTIEPVSDSDESKPRQERDGWRKPK